MSTLMRALRVFRYGGDFPALSETSIYTAAARRGNHVGFDIPCPFCSQAMEEVSLSGKRPEGKERRFKCADGHRVSLIPGKPGEIDRWR